MCKYVCILKVENSSKYWVTQVVDEGKFSLHEIIVAKNENGMTEVEGDHFAVHSWIDGSILKFAFSYLIQLIIDKWVNWAINYQIFPQFF